MGVETGYNPFSSRFTAHIGADLVSTWVTKQ